METVKIAPRAGRRSALQSAGGNSRLSLACRCMEALEDRLLFSTYTVTSLADDGSTGTLRWAVNQANQNASAAANTINFASGLAGTIALTGGELELTAGDTLVQGPGASALDISGGGMNTVFRVDFGATADFSGLTLSDGAGLIGAGLDNSGTTTLENIHFNNNVADGGVGGAVFNSGTLTVTDSTFTDNSASSGGAIYCNSGLLTVIGSTFNGNSVDTSGGAIYADFTTVDIANSTFTANTSAGQGGAVFLNSGSLAMTNATIVGNTAATDGAGLHVEPGAAATLDNTILSGNLLSDGITPGDLTGSLDQNLAPGQTASAFNLIGTNLGQLNLGRLQNNGGPTDTMALLPGSIAIDAGSNALAIDAGGSALVTDQRDAGFVRISGSAVDIGAFEFQVPAPPPLPAPVPIPASNESLTVTPVTGVTGTTAKLSAQLLDANGVAIAGVKITFMLNGKVVGHATTNSKGTATETVCLGGITPGVYASGITASFAGNATDAAIQGTGSLTVTDAPIKVHDQIICANSLNATTAVNFSQARAGAAASDFTATINWGDGSPLATGTVIKSHCGDDFTATGAHAYAAVTVKTTYTITITLTSKFGATVMVTEKITLNPPPIAQPASGPLKKSGAGGPCVTLTAIRH